MKMLSREYNTAVRSRGRRIEVKVELTEVHGDRLSNWRTYYGYDHVQSVNIETGSNTGFVIGTTVCAKATIQLVGAVSVTQYDKIKVSVAFHYDVQGVDMLTEYNSLGTFYVDRTVTKDNLTTITAFDKMLRLQKLYYQNTPINVDWQYYLSEILTKTKTTLDPSFVPTVPASVTITETIKKGTTNSGRNINFTYREALGYFASANATNFFFRDETLMASSFSDRHSIYDLNIYEIEIDDTAYAITGVEWTEDGQSYAQSSDDNYGKIQFVNPLKFSSKTTVLNAIESKMLALDAYYPCTVTFAGEGITEVGDYVTVVHQNVSKKIFVSGIKYVIDEGAFDETLYSSADSVSQSNYTSGNIPGQMVSPSVAGATATVKLDYITSIDFTSTGFISSFSNGIEEQQNTWNYVIVENDITALVNQTTGRIIAITGLETADEFLTASEVDEIWAEVIG